MKCIISELYFSNLGTEYLLLVLSHYTLKDYPAFLWNMSVFSQTNLSYYLIMSMSQSFITISAKGEKASRQVKSKIHCWQGHFK